MSFFRKWFAKKTPETTAQPQKPDPEPAKPTHAKPGPAAAQAPATRPEKQPASDPFARILTSQLAAFWLETKEDRYRTEYLRRMAMCGLEKKDAQAMLEYECEILTQFPRPEMLRDDFISMPLLTLGKPFLPHPVQYYETHFEYPFSYIVRLSDEAEWHFWNSHEKDLSDSVWTEIFELADRNKKLFIPFAMDLINHRNWTFERVNKFSFNEQGMLDRYRWGRSHSGASNNPWH